jgi:REP element-mobilizing transposase RayT
LIDRDDEDRDGHLAVVAQAMDRFDAHVLAYCLMSNLFHWVLHTRQSNLSRLMRQINGVYTQHFSRCHGLVGHLSQGRFKAILVDRDAYLLDLCRCGHGARAHRMAMVELPRAPRAGANGQSAKCWPTAFVR